MRVFVTHGHDELAKLKIKDFLGTRLSNEPVILGEQPGRQGLTIIEALERFCEGCEFAVILLTGDDMTKDGGLRARQNVVHEAGFFQGRLGRSRVVLVVQEGVEIPSNLSGLFYLQYKSDIAEVFSDLEVILKVGDASKIAREICTEPNLKLTVTFGYNELSMRYTEVHLEHPLSVCLRITEKCTRSCPHCCSEHSDYAAETADLMRLMTVIRRTGTPRLNISGGEPFTHPGIDQVLAYARELGFFVSVTTNGDRVTREHIRLMANYKVIPDLSLDGHTEELNDSIRGVGSFGRIMKVIEICRAEHVPYILNCTIQQRNLGYVDEFVSLGTNLYAKKTRFIAIRPQGLASRHPEILLSADDIKELRKKVRAYPENKMVGLLDLSMHPRSFVVIDPNGDIIAQSHEERDNYLAGNALRDEGEFSAAWLRGAAFNHRGHLLHYMGLQ